MVLDVVKNFKTYQEIPDKILWVKPKR